MKNPPFTITEKMLVDVAEISELVGKLSAHRLSASPNLRRTNRIRTIYGTLAIEQNTLSPEQVTALLNGRRVIAPPRDIAEVQNAYAVYEKLCDYDPYSVESLLSAHETMMHGLITEAGMFRSGAVGVADKDGNTWHFGTLPRYVPESVERLLNWVKDSGLPTVIKSCVFHYEFELIHPFADGNGRMGRLWHTLLLSEWNPLFAWLPVESIIHDRQAEYYHAINESNDAGESTAFIGFMLSAIKDALREAAGEEKPIGKNAQNAKQRREFVLNFLASHQSIRNADVCAGLIVSTATANRILNELCDDGIVKRVREGRYWAYRRTDL